MKPEELLVELQKRGVRVVAVDVGRLRLVGATDRLTPELLDQARRCKPALLALLQSEPHLDRGLAVADVLGLPAHLLHTLPLPPRLVLEVPGFDALACVDTSGQTGRTGRTGVVFDAMEWIALYTAAANERTRPGELAAWCERKHRRPAWRLKRAEAMGADIHDTAPCRWTVARVLACFDARLRAVVIDGEGDVQRPADERAEAQ